ncbi:MAG TPA: N-6 DNA methylase [Coleofasciculaceae cyanobacterium]|jgi:type I restriction enzyme M protein
MSRKRETSKDPEQLALLEPEEVAVEPAKQKRKTKQKAAPLPSSESELVVAEPPKRKRKTKQEAEQLPLPESEEEVEPVKPKRKTRQKAAQVSLPESEAVVEPTQRKRKTEQEIEQLPVSESEAVVEPTQPKRKTRQKAAQVSPSESEAAVEPTKPKRKTKQKTALEDSQDNSFISNGSGLDEESDEAEDDTTIADGYILDFISGEKRLKETPKEQVRQRIALAICHEYGVAVGDMEGDFAVKVGKRRKKLDIAIFKQGTKHEAANITHVVVCRPEPKVGKKSVRVRDHEQASKDLKELEEVMDEIESCQHGMWTNGLECFYLTKKKVDEKLIFEPIADWAPIDVPIEQENSIPMVQLRYADAEMLRTAFRRCHNFLHGNEGLPKDAAFWQFLYLIFCKMHDERSPREERRFWAGPRDQFEEEGRKAIRARIVALFEKVKKTYKKLFRGTEEISLSERALAFVVSELGKFEFTRTEIDVKGAAYQELVGANLRGDRGQYFTPRGVTKLVARMLDPKEDETVFDPACGTGGFLVAAMDYVFRKIKHQPTRTEEIESSEEFANYYAQFRHYVRTKVFGAEFDQFLVRTAQMNLAMASNEHGNLFNINSLEFPAGAMADVKDAVEKVKLGSIDVLMTNPPFGADIPITDPKILKQYDLAHIWARQSDDSFRKTDRIQNSVAPEILFIERCVQWLKPGTGRMGIVLPDGILGNPGAEYIRWWILRETQVLASIDLPVEIFIVDANVNILTSLLFLRRKAPDEKKQAEKPYDVFMAVAEKVGFDRRGNKLYKRKPSGEEIFISKQVPVQVKVGDRTITRELTVQEKELDDDLPIIGDKYDEFLQEQKQ